METVFSVLIGLCLIGLAVFLWANYKESKEKVPEPRYIRKTYPKYKEDLPRAFVPGTNKVGTSVLKPRHPETLVSKKRSSSPISSYSQPPAAQDDGGTNLLTGVLIASVISDSNHSSDNSSNYDSGSNDSFSSHASCASASSCSSGSSCSGGSSCGGGGGGD